MALKIELRPKERFIVGSTVITNGDHRTHIFIEGSEPILRLQQLRSAVGCLRQMSGIWEPMPKVSDMDTIFGSCLKGESFCLKGEI